MLAHGHPGTGPGRWRITAPGMVWRCGPPTTVNLGPLIEQSGPPVPMTRGSTVIASLALAGQVTLVMRRPLSS